MITLTLWGIRGTLPVPGPRSVRYGGNTPCVSIELGDEECLIFDAGTGIRALSNHFSRKPAATVKARIFISHPHWDHINALPFFLPLYEKGNHFDIYAASNGGLSPRDLIASQMDGVFFPITIHAFGASIDFHELKEQTLTLENGAIIRTMLLNHPGNCLGYRVEYKGHSICYVTDNELYPHDSEHYDPDYEKRLIEFVFAADILISDTTYMDDEYAEHMHWGHSAVGAVARLAHEAKVGSLFLFHHDPDQTDDDIVRKLESARSTLRGLQSYTHAEAPIEGESYTL